MRLEGRGGRRKCGNDEGMTVRSGQKGKKGVGRGLESEGN